MTNEEQMKEKYMQFQMIQQQLEQINQHLEMLNQQAAEIEISINAVKELGKTAIDNEILAPLANGIFIKAKLLDNQKLVVNVGSDTTVEKSVSEVVELLEEQQIEINKRMVETDSVMKEMSEQAMKLYQEVEASQ
ncbi:MAG: prefoldin subunit alpha [Nanoarchaeota archaeon]|nr:prefoldin subunit alpha [Nanoarchaeota archaeon]MBU1622450.1 prefoldin subunit alpha [Nanoarchaeota archaeon]MBU1974597.1 prefoldin subunit alpha [Nanoarchaeota archaeon]